MRWSGQAAGAESVRAWDGLALFWCVFWIVLGLWSGYQIHQLVGLADSTVQSGTALSTAGDALTSLSSVPLIGDQTGKLGGKVSATAATIVASGQDARVSVVRLSVLIGVAVALGPCAPILLGYLPLRLARRREVREVRRALDADPSSATLRERLAERAVAHLSFRELVTIGDEHPDPIERRDRLAAAELRRLGLRLSDGE